jgi:uncharacterized repeat protein (TIGR01451 family)
MGLCINNLYNSKWFCQDVVLAHIFKQQELEMHKKIMILVFITACLFLPISALAKPQIAIDMTSEKEIVAQVDGKEIKKKVPATEVEPGQTLIFTLKYSNNGDETATNVVIKNPIPKDTEYVVGSATGDTPMFSIDGGNVFKKPSLLTYELKNNAGKTIKKTASPEQYTDIRWIVQKVLSGSTGKVSFRVKVK